MKFSDKIYDWKQKPFITWFILLLTLLMYIMMTINGGSENIFTLIFFGAKVNERIIAGEWYRLITPVFLHIGITHLLYNGLIIYFLGSKLEMFIGHIRFLTLYLFSAILGNAASFAFNNAISAGASTAIFGMFTSTLVLSKLFPYHNGIRRLSQSYTILIIINILSGFFNGIVDNFGHFGGMLGGYLIMNLISVSNAQNTTVKNRFFYGLLYVIILILLIFIGLY